jgi:hypothetical protein
VVAWLCLQQVLSREQGGPLEYPTLPFPSMNPQASPKHHGTHRSDLPSPRPSPPCLMLSLESS